jgi:hypothetical protein
MVEPSRKLLPIFLNDMATIWLLIEPQIVVVSCQHDKWYMNGQQMRTYMFSSIDYIHFP